MAQRPVKRRDAVENAARIVAAAAEVYAERGLDAPVAEIAARAGVGKATVYRNFDTKADLVSAIAGERMKTFAEAAARAEAAPDAWTGFADYVEEVMLLQERDRSLGDALRHDVTPAVNEARLAILARIDRVLERAAADGVARRDANAMDMRAFVSGVASELTRRNVTDVEEWRRYARLIVDAFRATPRTRGS